MEDKKPESSHEAAERPNVVLSRRRRWAVTAGVMLGMFLAALEATVVGTAMPTVIASLGGLDRYSWVFSAYLLTSTVTVPLWGRLSDLYGRRIFYLIGIAFFLVGSALSGASQSIEQLIIFRAIQGLGAGALIPLSMTINGDIYTFRERARMQGLFSGVWGLASILGPLAGGFITDHLSWRWVFYINIPFGLAAAVVVGLALVEPKRTERPVIDYAGAAWLTLSVTLLLLVLVESGDPALWKSPSMIAAAIGTFIFGALFVWTERRAPEPIVPFSLFKNRMMTVGAVIGFLLGAAMFGALSFIPLFVQGVLSGTATEAGILLTPFLLGWVIMAVIGGQLMFRIGYRVTIISGLFVLAASSLWLTYFSRATPRSWLITDMALMGMGMGLVMFALLISVQNSVPRNQLGIATSVNQFSRSIGQTVGVALMGLVLTLSLESHLSEIQAESGLPEEEVARVVHNPSELIDPIARPNLNPALLQSMQSALGGALNNVFWSGAIFAVIGLIAGFWLPATPTRITVEEKVEPAEIPSDPAECERLLIAEMAQLDAENEPAIAERE
ncbi:MAG TPA: MDR family MFS transporter [Blastocatellia bacterium]|jgi:EmrB/QacA subfamily drug resistance transporter